MLLINPPEVIEYAFSRRELISSQNINLCRIDIAQERYIAARLGYELYDKLCAGEFKSFTDEYIKPALAHYVRYLLVDEMQILFGEKGCLVFSLQESSSSKKDSGTSDSTHDSLDHNVSDMSKYNSTTTPGSATSHEEQSVLVDRSEKVVDNKTSTTTDNKGNHAAAPTRQIHQLQIRALADANTLMSKAIRYVERNEDIFGTFKGSARHYF